MNWTDPRRADHHRQHRGRRSQAGPWAGVFHVAGALLSARLAPPGLVRSPGSLRLTANPGQNQAWALFLLFALLMAVVPTIIHVMHLETMILRRPFDGPLGAICGFFTRARRGLRLLKGLGSGAPETCSRVLFSRRRYCTSAPIMPSCAVSTASETRKNERLNIK